VERIDMVKPLSDLAVSYNCSDSNPGWYCDAKMTDLLRQYSETFDPARQKDLAAQIQAELHQNVNYVLAGQFSAPMAYRSDLQGAVPFTSRYSGTSCGSTGSWMAGHLQPKPFHG
jgi:peptide/nickel transport system substrate-binding protein